MNSASKYLRSLLPAVLLVLATHAAHGQVRSHGLRSFGAIANSILSGSPTPVAAAPAPMGPNGLKKRVALDEVTAHILLAGGTDIATSEPDGETIEWIQEELRRQISAHGRFYLQEASNDDGEEDNAVKPSRLRVVIVGHGTSQMDAASIRQRLESVSGVETDTPDESPTPDVEGDADAGDEGSASVESNQAEHRRPKKKSFIDRLIPKPGSTGASVSLHTGYIVADVLLLDSKGRPVKRFRSIGTGRALGFGEVRSGNPVLNAAQDLVSQIVRSTHDAMAAVPWETLVVDEGEHEGAPALVCEGGRRMGVKAGDVFQLMRPAKGGRVAIPRGQVRAVDVEEDQFTVVPVTEGREFDFADGDFLRVLPVAKR